MHRIDFKIKSQINKTLNNVHIFNIVKIEYAKV